jgi:hypothetical protein
MSTTMKVASIHPNPASEKVKAAKRLTDTGADGGGKTKGKKGGGSGGGGKGSDEDDDGDDTADADEAATKQMAKDELLSHEQIRKEFIKLVSTLTHWISRQRSLSSLSMPTL